MSLVDFLTAIVAIYAAALSTITLYVQIRAQRWRVVVTFGFGMQGDIDTVGAQAVNLGERPVTLTKCWFLYHQNPTRFERLKHMLNPKRLLPSYSPQIEGYFGPQLVIREVPPLPTTIEPGRAFEIVMYEEQVARYFAKFDYELQVFFAVEDETGQRYLSPAIPQYG